MRIIFVKEFHSLVALIHRHFVTGAEKKNRQKINITLMLFAKNKRKEIIPI